MKILGISGLYHDSAATLIDNEKIVAAAQEERFSRIKHDNRLPFHAINYCLDQAGIKMYDIDEVVYYDQPLLTLDRFLNNCFALGKNAEWIIDNNFEELIESRLGIDRNLRKIYGVLGKSDRLLTLEHHISHAASAFYPSPFQSAAILTIDGVGEWATTTIGIGKGNKIEILKEIDYPHSLGLLYSAFTSFCGFKVNSGDYKFMGLAPYGEPLYYDLIKKELIDIHEDGSFHVNIEYFDYYRGKYMTNNKFADLFDGPARKPESRITFREMNIAASMQKITEDLILGLATYAKNITNEDNLVMAGGVALNCVANGKLMDANIFHDIWIQPAAGDAGGSLGCALYAYYQKGYERTVNINDHQQGSYLGPDFSNEEIQSFLNSKGYPYTKISDEKNLFKKVALELSNQNIVGWFQGRMEFGPRALGNRSILGDPRSAKMQSELNLKIKYRESFRPFAPAVLQERTGEYFESTHMSPYMLLVSKVKKERQIEFDKQLFLEQFNGDMLQMVNVIRSDIPAVTHIDYSARVQTVSPETNARFYGLIKEFEEQTGCAVVINTSFNVRGEPIVCTPQEAYACFMRTNMDILVLGNYILRKNEQPIWIEQGDWRNNYVLD